jgi:hypothetical protein
MAEARLQYELIAGRWSRASGRASEMPASFGAQCATSTFTTFRKQRFRAPRR